MTKQIFILAIAASAFTQPVPTGSCRAPQTLTHGRPDNFASNGPELPAFVSPALSAYITSNRVPTKGFDDPAQDRWVADSLQLSGCRVCGDVVITLNIRRQTSNLAAGDTILLGLTPFTAPNILANVVPWMNTTARTKTVTITIPRAQMNQFIINQPAGPV